MAQNLNKQIPAVSRRVVLFAGLVFVLFPLLWLLKSSFVTNEETLIAPIQYLPRSFTLNNYLQPLLGISVTIRGEFTESPEGISPLVNYIKNGAIVAFFVVTINVFLATLTGYGFSRFRFFGRKSLLVLLLNTQMFPYIAILVPLYIMYRSLGLLNTYTGLIIGEVGLVLPFSIWMIKSFCDTIDEDLEDAALIDGGLSLAYFVEHRLSGHCPRDYLRGHVLLPGLLESLAVCDGVEYPGNLDHRAPGAYPGLRRWVQLLLLDDVRRAFDSLSASRGRFHLAATLLRFRIDGRSNQRLILT